MDLDAYVAAHQASWQRLEFLVGRRHLTGPETDELIDRIESASTQLSEIRSVSPDPALVQYLSALLVRARLKGSAARGGSWSGVATFVGETFPAALFRLRWWWLGTMVANVVLAQLVAIWVMGHPQTYTTALTPQELDQLVNVDFEQYYSTYAHHEFAAQVWVNNAWVAAQCIAFGVLGLPVLYVLWQNTLNLGMVGAIMVSHDRAGLFFGLILPHGLLELTAVFVAGGVGLRLFWSWVVPGPRSRAAALAAEGRTAAGIAVGLVGVLLVSGAIEGFVTPSGLPTWARIMIGVAAEAAFFAYVFVLGRRAARSGVTGDVSQRDSGATLPVAG